MKLAKMSMVAALLLGANAYAIDNVKVNGDAKLFYATTEVDGANQPDLFDQDASAGQAAFDLGVTADLTSSVSAGATLTVLSTLGLDSNLVSNVWENGAEGTATNSDYWFSEAWLATTMGNTTAKVGRQALDTPLAFTETWSIAQNTFESIVLVNQDIEDTTLVGAWIGKSNGAGGTSAYSGVVADSVDDSRFSTFHAKGAYAIGAINNSIKPLTINAWYYEAPSTASAIWASADLNMEGILAGVQYATFDPAGAGQDGSVYAAMLGYEMKDVATVKVAYSSTDKDAGAGGNLDGAQSKLYTEMWWNYGNIVQANTDALAVTVEGSVMGTDLTAGYYNIEEDVAAGDELEEITLTASRSYGALDTSLVVILTDDKETRTNAATGDSTAVQVYLTYNF